jgi:hypothetical protein
MISGAQELFEGFKCVYQRGVSRQFVIGHHFSLGGKEEDEQKGTYNLTADFAQDPVAIHCRFDPAINKAFTHFSLDKKTIFSPSSNTGRRSRNFWLFS